MVDAGADRLRLAAILGHSGIDAGHLAITVFVKSSGKEVSGRERIIAEIARAVHAFFLFQPRAAL